MDRIRGFIYRLNPQKDCDLIDRIICYYTVLLLTIFSFIIFGWSLFGTPIQCWFPAQYRGWWAQYALDYCYVQNTYFVKFNEGKPKDHWELGLQRVELPHSHEDRKSLTIGYYQWVPFVLALMAISFYAPVVFWRSMYEHSGIAVRMIMEKAGDARNTDLKNRVQVSQRVADYLDQTKKVSERFRNSVLAGRYVALLYLLTKVLCVIVCVGQFFVLKHFLGVDSPFWGITVLNDIGHGREWTETDRFILGNFPRVTLCDYKVRDMGNIHHHTVHCVLLINMLNEKIFVFLWFWLAFCAILSLLSLMYWAFYALYPNSERQFVAGYLFHVDPMLVAHKQKKKILSKFVGGVLKQDGVFLLRLIVYNSGDLMCADLLNLIWRKYKENNKVDFGYGKSLDDAPLSKLPEPNVRLADFGPPLPISRPTPILHRNEPESTPTRFSTLPSYEDVDRIKHRRAPPPPPPPPRQ